MGSNERVDVRDGSALEESTAVAIEGVLSLFFARVEDCEGLEVGSEGGGEAVVRSTVVEEGQYEGEGEVLWRRTVGRQSWI